LVCVCVFLKNTKGTQNDNDDNEYKAEEKKSRRFVKMMYTSRREGEAMKNESVYMKKLGRDACEALTSGLTRRLLDFLRIVRCSIAILFMICFCFCVIVLG